MSILKYKSLKDTTITNAFKQDLINRATGSNMGASDSLEVFSIFGQATTSSLENSRIIMKFDVDSIINDRSSSKIDLSGSVNFFLKLHNAEHPFSLPKNYNLKIAPLIQNWDEGYGLDMEGYSDAGYGDGGYGANWIFATQELTWSGGAGGTTSSLYNYTQHIEEGPEDIDVNITDLVEAWIAGNIQNNGILISMSGAAEDGTSLRSFYTKKFFSRTTDFFYKSPSIEARWDSSRQDDRNNFYSSSSLLSNADNTYNLFFYNRVAGKLKNIYGDVLPSVRIYSDSQYQNLVTTASSVITNPSAGTYKCALILGTTASVLYDKWYNTSSLTSYFSSSFEVNQYQGSDYDNQSQYIINFTNLKSKYSSSEYPVFKIYIRERDWSPTIYSVATTDIENTILKDVYYKVFRVEDNESIIDYSTGSIAYTKLSYDKNGLYFSLNMNLLEPDYSYGIKLARYDGTNIEEFKEIFKFRVV